MTNDPATPPSGSTVVSATLTFGAQDIAYTLERLPRRTLAITVRPDSSVHVRAPLDTLEARIIQTLRRRAPWILRQQRFFAQFLPRTPARQYVSGETHLYLGRQYRLRVCPAEQEAVKLRGAYIYVYASIPHDAPHIQKLLGAWYAARAQARFQERLAICLHSLADWHPDTPALHIRRLSHRWGSCSPQGALTLNVDLIRAPRACIDYVITHELCHLRCPNHSQQFYKLLSAAMPDWKDRKLRLEKMLA